MYATMRWLVIAMLILNLNNNCFARNLFDMRNKHAGRRGSNVTLDITSEHVVMKNGIIRVTLANPLGFVTGISYRGVDNLLEEENDVSNRGYFDVVWDAPGRCGESSTEDCIDELGGTTFNIIELSSNRSEISFSAKWNPSSWADHAYPTVPLNVDRRYVMFKGLAGFYSYIILDRERSFPVASIHQIRAVYKLQANRFHYMAISDDRQRLMPTVEDRAKGEVLDYKEAVRLTDPIDPHMKGEVDDKYQYTCDDKDNKVHGWIAYKPNIGFWLISPSDEYRSAGPFKQDLTSHVGPTCLQMFHSAHYGGDHLALTFKKGEAWKKVFGPFLIYLNFNKKSSILWEDAKHQMEEETRRWPYIFPLSKDYAMPNERGSVIGQLFVKDRYQKRVKVEARNAWVGLAAVGDVGSWQIETKGYQFWVMADEEGCFFIRGVLEGTYNLYATVPGVIGDYKYPKRLHIKHGRQVKLRSITYEPLRNGPTLWEIGIPDRTAEEFFIPNPNPHLVNKVFVNKPHHKFRQYGLWQQYTELYPNNDLVYTIDESDYHNDWFFAHVPRKVEGNYTPTTWEIAFPLPNLEKKRTYTLRLAIAAASSAEIQVRFNNRAKVTPDYTTGLFGKDNAIARHGIHGLYYLYSVNVPSYLLHRGNNSLYLTQARSLTPIDGVMYDYIRFEGPSKKAYAP